MKTTINSTTFGVVILKDVMIEGAFNTLEEGIDVISESKEFEDFDMTGFCVEDILNLIKINPNFLDEMIQTNENMIN